MSHSARRITCLLLLAWAMCLAGCAQWTPSPESYVNPLPSAGATPVAIPQRAVNSAARATQGRPAPVVRYQTPQTPGNESAWNDYAPGDQNHFRYPMAVSGQGAAGASSATLGAQQAQYTSPQYQQGAQAWGVAPTQQATPAYDPYGPPPLPQNNVGVSPAPQTAPGNFPPPSSVPVPTQVQPTGNVWNGSSVVAQPVVPPAGPQPPPAALFTAPLGPPGGRIGVPTPLTDVIVNVQEAQTGKLSVGAAVNSDAGLTGQIVIDEQNFDFRRVPTSLDDWVNGTAFRGAGQGFRLEALPGNRVQRYVARFTEPYLMGTRVSFNVSGSYFTRRFFDWDEERLGGRFGFGYRITPELSVQAGMRLEEIEISNPRVPGVPELDAAVGRNELYGVRFSLTQDTRDIPFAPTQGYYFDLSYEQVFGTFDYPRFTADFRRHFLLAQRPDTSGRHVLSFMSRVGIAGSQTPIYENFFAGGYGTLRGFDFRGANPTVDDVAVGGELSLLSTIEYRFPLTADDMLQGVVFCDYGTVEEELKIHSEDYRVAFGAGLRIYIPAMGPAPIAVDFAVPVAREDTDDISNFSFYVGASR